MRNNNVKNRICTILDKLSNAVESPDSGTIVNEEWLSIVEAIKSENLFSETQIYKLEELDRKLKWELLDSDKEDFDWSNISWYEIKEAARECNKLLCG